VKRRFFGTVLIGLGVLFVVLAVGLRFYVAPSVSKLPYDMQQCPQTGAQPDGCLKPSVAEAVGATFLDRSTGQIRQGTLHSTTWVVPDAKTTADWQATGNANRLGDNAIVWTVYGEANWVDGGGALVSAYSTQLALDRTTGAAVEWDAQWLDEEALRVVPRRNVEYEGQVYKFPFGTEQKDYLIFDRDLREALPAEFVEVTSVNGIEAYHFRQTIPSQEAANVTPATLTTLRSIFAEEATSAQVMYSNVREVWVDPVTGAFLNVREQQKKVLVPDVGPETTLLQADFNYTSDTVANAVNSAKNNHARLKLVTLYGPVLFGLLALLCLLGGFLMLGRRSRPQPEPGAWDANLPRPRHRLRGDQNPDREGVLTDTIPGSTPTWQGARQGGRAPGANDAT
jgi:hypothetical protein